jgi:hypothetical protein
VAHVQLSLVNICQMGIILWGCQPDFNSIVNHLEIYCCIAQPFGLCERCDAQLNCSTEMLVQIYINKIHNKEHSDILC